MRQRKRLSGDGDQMTQFNVGDIVQFNKMFLDAMGPTFGYHLDGKVMGYDNEFILVEWSDGQSNLVHPNNLELK